MTERKGVVDWANCRTLIRKDGTRVLQQRKLLAIPKEGSEYDYDYTEQWIDVPEVHEDSTLPT